jgi:hypothetical protein
VGELELVEEDRIEVSVMLAGSLPELLTDILREPRYCKRSREGDESVSLSALPSAR